MTTYTDDCHSGGIRWAHSQEHDPHSEQLSTHWGEHRHQHVACGDEHHSDAREIRDGSVELVHHPRIDQRLVEDIPHTHQHDDETSDHSDRACLLKHLRLNVHLVRQIDSITSIKQGGCPANAELVNEAGDHHSGDANRRMFCPLFLPLLFPFCAILTRVRFF